MEIGRENLFTIDNYIDRDENVTVMTRTENNAPPHVHQFIELVYTRRGVCWHTVNGHRYHVSPGDMLFINYDQVHSIEVESPVDLVNFLFTPEFISNSLLNSENIADVFAFAFSGEDVDMNLAYPIARFRGEDYMEIEALVSSMIKEYEEKKPGYRSMLKAQMQMIFCMMLRNIKEQESDMPDTTLHKIAPEILRYIDVNCADKLTLQNLAEKCFYTPNYFSRMFKETCGKSLTEYIKEKRITEAMRLLRETDMPVAEVSRIVGYSDRKAFYKFFKQFTAETPADYRSKYKTDTESE